MHQEKAFISATVVAFNGQVFVYFCFNVGVDASAARPSYTCSLIAATHTHNVVVAVSRLLKACCGSNGQTPYGDWSIVIRQTKITTFFCIRSKYVQLSPRLEWHKPQTLLVFPAESEASDLCYGLLAVQFL